MVISQTLGSGVNTLSPWIGCCYRPVEVQEDVVPNEPFYLQTAFRSF